MDADSPLRNQRWKTLSAIAAGLALGAGAFLLAHYCLGPTKADSKKPGDYVAPKYFAGWDEPDFVFVISGQTYNYIQPCGCSYPQYGGLVRRSNLIQTLRDKGWKVFPIEMGDIGPKTDHNSFFPKQLIAKDQVYLKYRTILQSLHAMGYHVFGLGETDLKLDLPQIFAQLKNDQADKLTPICLTLGKNETLVTLGTKPSAIVNVAGKKGALKIGIASALGVNLQAGLNGQYKFENNGLEVPNQLAHFKKENTDFNFLIYHGSEEDAKTAADWCFKVKTAGNIQGNKIDIAAVDVVLAADKKTDEPPAIPTFAEGVPTHIYVPGHKGKYVGVLAVYKKAGGGFDLKYELVRMGPEFDTPKDKEAGHPVMKIMQAYADEIAEKNLAQDFGRREHESAIKLAQLKLGGKAYFAGTDRCKDCHSNGKDGAYDVWKKTGHAHAWETLVERPEHPKKRQADGECIVCHTVGFEHPTGYLDPPMGAKPEKVAAHNSKLHNVGCESCHGPSGMHADDPDETKFYPIINAYSPKHAGVKPDMPEAVQQAILKNLSQRIDANLCQKCHDIENDVHWNTVPFAAKWAQVAHPSPKKNPAAPGVQPKAAAPQAPAIVPLPPAIVDLPKKN